MKNGKENAAFKDGTHWYDGFLYAKVVDPVAGIDASAGMIDFARKRALRSGCGNVEFRHLSAALFAELGGGYDYAVMTQFLHEVPQEIRMEVVRGAKRIAKKLIIADFTAPFPENLTGRFFRLVEFIEGRENSRYFRDWLARGGMDGFIADNGLVVEEEKRFNTGVGKIVLASF